MGRPGGVHRRVCAGFPLYGGRHPERAPTRDAPTPGDPSGDSASLSVDRRCHAPHRLVTWRSHWIPVSTGMTEREGCSASSRATRMGTHKGCPYTGPREWGFGFAQRGRAMPRTAPPRDLAVTLDSRFHGNDGEGGGARPVAGQREWAPTRDAPTPGQPSGDSASLSVERRCHAPHRLVTWRSHWIPAFAGMTERGGSPEGEGTPNGHPQGMPLHQASRGLVRPWGGTASSRRRWGGLR